jgi:hypothetical protein
MILGTTLSIVIQAELRVLGLLSDQAAIAIRTPACLSRLNWAGALAFTYDLGHRCAPA